MHTTPVELIKFDGQPHTFIAKDPSPSASRDALGLDLGFR